MIEFHRSDDKVIVKVKSTIGWTWYPEIDTGSNPYAILLRQQLQEDLNNKLRAIRQEAYLKGWKDAKARTKKETWFSGWW